MASPSSAAHRSAVATPAISSEAPQAEILDGSPYLRGWFTRLVRAYVKRYRARHPEREALPRGVTQAKAAKTIIRRACWSSAGMGMVTGATSTSATVWTAQTEGMAGLVAIPIALGTMGAELVARSMIHLHMTLELGDVFAIPWDPNAPADLWHLYGLAFGTQRYEETDSEDPGRELLRSVIDAKADDIGQQIGAQLFNESIARNIVPFVSVVSSSTTNWVRTRNLGDTVRRYMRYRHALDHAVAPFERDHRPALHMLLEGIWFLFIADGHLNLEETATLATLLGRLPADERADLSTRFIDDELDWTERLSTVPDPLRDAFLHALEVAASVDKIVSLPERKLLRRAALELGRKIEPRRIQSMIQQLEEVGVLTAPPANGPSTHRSSHP